MKTKNNNLVKDQDNNISTLLSQVVFSLNERVIWDSNFGYEIGRFLGEGNQYDTYLIDMMSGLIRKPCSHSKSQIYKYTDELIDKLTAKYHYEKRFSDVF